RTVWEKTFDAIADWVCIIDQDHNIKHSNQGVKKLLNKSPEEFIGKKCYEVIHCTRTPVSDCPVIPSVQNRERESMEFQAEDGRWFQVTVDPLYLENSEKTLFVHILRDITDMKQREESLLFTRKSEAFRILSGGIAHDYNNLLTVIWGNISLLREEMKQSSKRKLFEAAERACEQARDLTHKFITLSRCTMLNKSFVEIHDILNPAIEQAGLSNKDKIKLTCSIPEDIYVVEADSELLIVAIKNILINAIEAMPSGGELSIKIESVSLPNTEQKYRSHIKISVSDTGQGINKSDLFRVFDPYFTTKSMGAQKGMGLGLAVAQSIVQKNGGNLQILSTHGKGTTAVIYLPLVNLAPYAGKRKSLPPVTEKPTVLFMEDDALLRETLEKMLEILSCEVLSSSHGKEAIDIFEEIVKNKRKIDLILLDQNIDGGIGGIDTLKALRKQGFKNRAILVTGSPNSPAISDFKKYGFDGCLLKPFGIRELEKIIKLYLPGVVLPDFSRLDS
ncbi:MAG: response regulator, partial [Desulfamplus sp.]|nr:response regulator [Desulfamplus sp.]